MSSVPLFLHEPLQDLPSDLGVLEYNDSLQKYLSFGLHLRHGLCVRTIV